jgi:hypothetical protein
MIAFFAALCGGVISAVITLTLGQPLQHYFWTRQRQAERQLAVIDEANSLAAEVHFLLLSGEDITPRAEKLFVLLGRTAANVHTLFSKEGYEAFEVLNKTIGVATLQVSPERTPEQRNELSGLLIRAQNHALEILYREMGIPAPSFGQWMREYAWQPLRGQVWDHPRRYWRDSGWPALQRWGAQIRERNRRS